ncbi:transposase [Rhodothermus marinus]|uniref:transposase n=1 Tax=Rhodothermus marinus TaxID=29549 RepID=UPI0021D05584|nr:transposase [Rhodothermus marinus]
MLESACWWSGTGLPAHRGKHVRAFLSEEQGRIHVERLPGYAPELNPKEGIFKHLKRVELKNLCCAHLEALTLELRRAKERLRHKRSVIEGCFRQVGLL